MHLGVFYLRWYRVDNGWIKLHRKIMSSQVWRNPDLYQVWCWCLLKANHKETWLSVTTGKGSTQVKLLPGQFIYGRKSAAKDLKMKPESIRNRMQKLQNMENLTIQPTTHYSIVTICNWDEYQSIENETNHPLDHAETTQPPTKDQPKATDKNVKNDNNVNNSIPTPEEIMTGWNDICGDAGLPHVTKLSEERKRKLRLRLKTYPDEKFWQTVLNKIPRSKFLMGDTSNWKANFDWLIANNQNPLKISEGQYDDSKNG